MPDRTRCTPLPRTHPLLDSQQSELQLVRELALGEAEGGREVLGEVVRLLHGGDDGLVDLLLVRRARLGEGFPVLGLAVGEELLLGRLAALLPVCGEVCVRELVVEL